MVDRLAATRFLAVLGSSGTGKSSVVKTGLLDALDLGLMAAAGSTWRVVDFKPGGAPLKNLALRAACKPGPRGPRRQSPSSDDRCRAVARFSAARSAVGGGMVRRRASAGGHQSPAAGRSIRGTVPLSGLCRPRGGRGLRRACCWKARGRAKVPIYVALDDALGISRRLRAHRRPGRSDQHRHGAHSAHDAASNAAAPSSGRPRSAASRSRTS